MYSMKRQSTRCTSLIIAVAMWSMIVENPNALASEAGAFQGNRAQIAVLLISTDRYSDYKLTSPASGVSFDLDGSGVARHLAWTPAKSELSFLAIDTDGDGRINSGKELVTTAMVPGASNCFVALQKLAMQANGGVVRASVSSEDPLFAKLLLWNDANHNGIGEKNELTPIAEVVSDIGLGYQDLPHLDDQGSRFGFRGWIHVRTEPGRNQVESPEENVRRTRSIWEVFLAGQ
jgi:hypothetical protein